MHRIMVDSFLKLNHINFFKMVKANDTAQIDELAINFVQYSGALPIKQVIETPGSDRSKANTVLVLNIDPL